MGMPPPKGPVSADTRNRLLRCAEKVFARLGYARTTVADITGEAGTSRATFYQYFESKGDVFSSVVTKVHERLIAAQRVPDVDPDDHAEVARRSMTAALDQYVADRRLLVVVREQALNDPDIAALLEQTHAHAAGRTRRFLERVVADGNANLPSDPQAIGEATVGMVARYADLVEAHPDRRELLASQLGDMFVRLIGIDDGS
ncbi:TetR/AcrR family transcriptional regulator [Mobilicoccus caccae]|uniref:HTH tetR-type domain-containing protein n=1 Tax=Mobilicoccus caccae TaxID=1859295 RepID=A0ABQ6ITZ0_9MICO|nr:TetR/AcrR family transcriptional regulator [Mobilicoccus caccae]GMA40622.1 hypothetical protein GCM10025883_26670 [Mobilicoccus caccae]